MNSVMMETLSMNIDAIQLVQEMLSGGNALEDLRQHLLFAKRFHVAMAY